jgi:hypothetical protein
MLVSPNHQGQLEEGTMRMPCRQEGDPEWADRCLVAGVESLLVLWLDLEHWRVEPAGGCLARFFLVHIFRLAIHKALHRFVVSSVVFFVRTETASAVSATGTSTRTFIVPSQSVPAGELSATFGADMGPLASVKLSVALQIVQSAEARLARLTDVRLFMTMGQKVAFQIVMSCELGGTIRTTMLFVGG